MDSDFFPVVIRCKEVCVAIPIKLLIKESQVFNTLYTSCQIRDSDSAHSSSFSGSNSSLQDNQVEEADVIQEVLLEGQSCNKNEKIKDQPLESPKKKWKKDEQIDSIDLSSFNPSSVMILFTYLKGYPELILSCKSLNDLYGTLQICEEYSISSPVKDILETMKTCDTISADNLVKAMEILENIEAMQNYEDIASALFQRCVCYARSNYASWQVIMEQMIMNKTKVDVLIRILKELRDGDEATVRFKVEKFSTKLDSTLTSSTFVVKNLEWKLGIELPSEGHEEVQFIVHCNNPCQKSSWHCHSNIQLKIVDQIESKNSFECDLMKSEFDTINRTDKLCNSLTLDEIREDNEYMKGDTVIIEVKISIKSMEGSPTSMSLSDKDVGWYNKVVLLEKPQQENNHKKSDCFENDTDDNTEDDIPVIFSCDNSFAIISKSCLIAESSVFRTMFNGLFIEGKSCDPEKCRHIQVTGFHPLAVKILLDYLQDHTNMMDDCKNVTYLSDMLLLADYYLIARPQAILIHKIINLDLNMANVVDCFGAAQKLGLVESFAKLSSNLLSRCITYLRYNLFNWNILINFIVSNSESTDLVLNIVEQLTEEKVANIRMKIENFNSKCSTIKITKEFIHKNLLWKITLMISQNEVKHILQSPAATSQCISFKKNWTCNVTQRMHLHKPSNFIEFRSFESEPKLFSRMKNKGDASSIIKMDELLDKGNVYVKDDCVYFELRIIADEVTGSSFNLGIPENILL